MNKLKNIATILALSAALGSTQVNAQGRTQEPVFPLDREHAYDCLFDALKVIEAVPEVELGTIGTANAIVEHLYLDEQRGLFRYAPAKRDLRTELTRPLADELNYISQLHGMITSNRSENPRTVLRNLETSLNEELGFNYTVPEYKEVIETQEESTGRQADVPREYVSRTNSRATIRDYNSQSNGNSANLSLYKTAVMLGYNAGSFNLGIGAFRPNEDINETLDTTIQTASPYPGFTSRLIEETRTSASTDNLGLMANLGYNISDKLSLLAGVSYTNRETISEKKDTIEHYIDNIRTSSVSETYGLPSSRESHYSPLVGARLMISKKLGLDVLHTNHKTMIGGTFRFGG